MRLNILLFSFETVIKMKYDTSRVRMMHVDVCVQDVDKYTLYSIVRDTLSNQDELSATIG